MHVIVKYDTDKTIEEHDQAYKTKQKSKEVAAPTMHTLFGTGKRSLA